MNMETNSQMINDETKKEEKNIERLRPSVTVKPKPPVAKKPVIASKPANPVCSTGRKADVSSEQPFSATNGQSFSRPKGPPPPLPKDPPQGPTCPKSLPSKNPPVVSKARPPPLPKTPPRGPGGVKMSSSTVLHSPTCSPEVLVYKCIESVESTLPLQSNLIGQSHGFHSNNSCSTSDKNVASDTLLTKESTFENNNSTLSVYNESIQDENKNNILSVLPEKKLVLKNVHDIEVDKTVGEHSDPYNLNNVESADSSSDSQDKLTFSIKQPAMQCKLYQQKPVPRRPAPKPPSKTVSGKISQNTISQEPGSSENVNGPSRNRRSTKVDYRDGISANDKLSQIESLNAKENSNPDCRHHKIEPCLTQDKIDNAGNHLVDESFVTLRKKSKQDSGATSVPSVSRVLTEVQSIPTHVNSKPREKPRPVPRKRLSLNKQPDQLNETQSLQSASSNLSLKTDSRDSDVNVNKIQDTGSSLSSDKASEESFSAKREHVKDLLEITKNNLQRHQMVFNDSDDKMPNSAILTVKNCDTYATIDDNDNNKADDNANNKTDENDNKKIYLHNPHQQNYKTNAEEGRKMYNGKRGISDLDESDIKESSNLKGSFENILGENLDTSSLLNEIEAILSRSYKQPIHLNDDSSEKLSLCNDLDKVYKGRSMSLDSGSSNADTDDIPVKPPRIRKEQLRQKLQNNALPSNLVDLETVSLPDNTQSLVRVNLGQPSDIYFITEREDGIKTLGPARKHPPKPERKKLLSLQRSQSDLSQRKIVETRVSDVQRSKSSATGAQSSINDLRSNSSLSSGVTGVKKSEAESKPNSYRTPRPSRKAPLPPNVMQNIESGNSDMVHLPQTEKCADVNTDNVKDPTLVSVYHCINDNDIKDFSDEDHDYHEIPDDLDENVVLKPSGASSMTSLDSSPSSRPKLPPRNCTAQYMDSSSVSSLTPDVDNISIVTGGSSSTEDVSNGYLKPEVSIQIVSSEDSPNLGRTKEFSEKIGKSRTTACTSQKKIIVCDNFKGSEGSLALSNASEGCDKVEMRPDSCISLISSHSDSGSHGSRIPDDLLSSSESETEGEESKVMRKKEKKLYLIAKEIVSSERVFVDVLKLLNLDFRIFVSKAAERHGRPVVPADTLNRILDYLPQLQNFNEDLLKDLEERLRKWESQKRISDIFVKKGPFLKLYSSYIRDFENMTSTLDDAIKRYPHFEEVVREFE
ncbi:hypothetical protein ACJMK2_016861, partial [Sinanodonta woodiana]